MEVKEITDSVCKKCDKIVSNREGMTNHMKSHKKAEKIKIKCDKYKFETHDGDVLLTHISELHVKFLKCLTCGNAFINMADLVAHALKKHSITAECNRK